MKSRREANTAKLARLLGWAALGVGIVQLIAPRRMSHVLGVKPTRLGCWVMRTLGAKELAAGLGILRRENPRQWLRARAIGHAVEMALLINARASANRGLLRRGSGASRLGTSLAGLAGVAALDLLALRNSASEDKLDNEDPLQGV